MLSIIIPTLNEEKYLPRLLECIKDQKTDDYEVIVSDGNSSDKTLEMAKKYGCKTIVSHKRSPAHQRNEGARIAKGELFLFLDADSLLPDNFFQPVLDEFKRKNLDVAGFFFKFNSDKGKYKIASVWGYINQFLFCKIHPISIGAAILVKKEYHQKVKGFDETVFIGEDHLYSASIKKVKGKYGIIYTKKILFSARRFEREGLLKVTFKWYYLILHYLIYGPLRKKVVEYEFGKN